MHWNSWLLLFRSHRCCYLLRTCEIYTERFHFLVMSGAINIESWTFIIFKRDVSFLSVFKFSGTKVPCTLGWPLLRVLDCIVTISFGVYLVLWLFNFFCVWVFGQSCGCCNTCTCIYCVLYCLYCVFVLFRLCIFILICFVCTRASVRTTTT
jgi:hypothetical protein